MNWQEAAREAAYVRFSSINRTEKWHQTYPPGPDNHTQRALDNASLCPVARESKREIDTPITNKFGARVLRVIPPTCSRSEQWGVYIGDCVEFYDQDRRSLGIYTVGEPQSAIQSTEGDQMSVVPHAVRTMGGYRAQVLFKKTTDNGAEMPANEWPVVWESENVYTDDMAKEGQTGKAKALAAANELIEEKATELFA